MGCCDEDNFDPEAVGVVVQDDGVTIVPEATVLNFVGAGVTVTDVGGVATINIPGFVDTKQVFRYIATGLEANPFPVALPAARPDANYNVQCTMGGPAANALKDARPLVASFAVGTFDVELSAAAQAGDIFMFTVEQLT